MGLSLPSEACWLPRSSLKVDIFCHIFIRPLKIDFLEKCFALKFILFSCKFLQPEGGHQEVQEVLGEELGAKEILVWSRLPGQSCKVFLP